MKRLFDPVENNLVQARINKLTPGTQPLWGKMNVSQMLAHLQQPILIAFGQLKLKGGLIGLLFGKIAKRQMVNDAPFKKNIPTMKEFKFTGKNAPEKQFLKEKDTLLSYVDRFIREGPGVIANKTHPFFGKLTIEEWDILQWKHLDHHLRQFGV
ncbi:MAG: DUF1569 domain-containing protein [Ginsengibacter sp.]